AGALSKKIPGANVAMCEAPPEVGAAWLAAQERSQIAQTEELAGAVQLVSSTEEANPKSANLDRFSAREIVDLFVREEKSVDERGVKREDLVIGISASGRAAFVMGALRRVREIGAQTIFMTCNASQAGVEATVPAAISSAADTAASTEKMDCDLVINLAVGPEIIAGSTRLKAGTATKVALNIISTGAMVRLGRVRGNLMIDLQPTNKKLRERAIGLVAQLAGCDRESARSRLARADWNLRVALQEK